MSLVRRFCDLLTIFAPMETKCSASRDEGRRGHVQKEVSSIVRAGMRLWPNLDFVTYDGVLCGVYFAAFDHFMCSMFVMVFCGARLIRQVQRGEVVTVSAALHVVEE